ncbi:putative T7SS-secreted protein [Streptomyces sp. NPDC002889]|uniref:putative T7SS-secreted protein n=1 Tax=Streptomyces sp. NPDC002889 TaxID=3364669 RepID=UPI003693B790
MGIGDFVSDITPDVVEDAVEDATEWAGNRVEDAGNWTADRMEDVGWDSGADWVREQSRSLATRMGAEVDEMDLGQTEDKTKLVYGSPSKIRSTASHLKDFQKAFNNVGLGLEGLDSDTLKGQAADAFRATVKIEPPKWFKGADACEKAAGALEAFAGTVEWAQGQAQTAIEKWKAGTKASEEAWDAYKSRVDTYDEAAKRYNAQPPDQRDPSTLPAKPGEFSDPGKARMEEAQQILAEARKQRNAAAETARSAVTAARDAAPPKPSYAEQALDGLNELQVMNTHFGAGIVKGTAGLLTFVRSVNPTDLYNITHPAEYGLALNNMAAGLVQVANDPWGAGKQMLDDFMKDPAEGFGRLVPDALLTAATGGAGAGVKGVRLADELSDAANAARRADNVADASRKLPDKCCGREPVDFATGRMLLAETDVFLPGSLPLEFRRDYESSYRAGRWFGPTWSSTIDQRLTVDPLGVVFHGEDNLLLAFPHPAPGLPVLAEAGPRWPLERHADGTYTLTDPDTGHIRHFLAPPGAEPGGNGIAPLAELADRGGHTITADYDEGGAPLALTHSGGYRLTFTTEDGRITSLRLSDIESGPTGSPRSDPGGTELVRYGYQDGHLTEVTRSSGMPLRFEYDPEGRITAWTDTNASRFTFVYDEQDRCVTQSGTEGHLRSEFRYSDPDPETGLRTTSVTDSLGRVWRYTVNGRLQVIAETDPTGATVRTTHDRCNRILTRTDPLGAVTVFDYDDAGRLTAVTRADGSGMRAAYSDLGLPVELTREGGARWQQEFDERGNRLSVTDPAGRTTRYTHDSLGHLASVTDALGAVTRLRHNAAGLLVEREDPAGGITRYRRDAFGRITELVLPDGAVTGFGWTLEGRLACRTGPDGARETWTHDGEGNCTSHTDPMGRVTHFEYTHFDLLTARTDPDGARYEFVHDTELRLARVTNPQGLSWSYAYDGAGRLIGETDFDERTTGYEVDPVGRVSARITPLGETVRYERDVLGRVTSKDAAGHLTTYAYDPAGRLVQAAGPDSELIYQYDREGRVKTELVDGRAITYAYDGAGRRARRMTPGGQVTSYAYDTAGRPARLTADGREVDFTRDESGRELARRFGGTLTLTSVRDGSGRVTEQEITAGGRSLNRRSYTYREDGHLIGVDDAMSGRRRFDLDPVGRVTAVTAAGWTESYAYDRSGNQTTAAWPDRHAGSEARGDRAYTGTRVVRAGAYRYEHDAAGRLIRRTKARLSKKPDTWRYSYDAEDRLTEVITPDGTLWRYRYDPLGRRTRKERMAPDGESVLERTDFTWDGTILAEQTTAPAGAPHLVTLTWDHQGLTPIAQTERLTDCATQREIDTRFFAIATDLIGTPTELVDDRGDIAWRSRTTLWGTTTWNADASAYTPLRFPGQYYDPETGLHYNHHRYYDPQTARYTTPDPLGLAPAPNPSAYVHNPHTWSDPLGLAPYENNGGLGQLVKVNKPDPAADALAERLGGESRVKFENDPKGREIDAISDEYVAQSKPEGMQMGSALRNQAKATFEYAIQSGRTPYFHFDGEPGPGVIDKLKEYGRRYGIEPVIDTTPLE